MNNDTRIKKYEQIVMKHDEFMMERDKKKWNKHDQRRTCPQGGAFAADALLVKRF